jgi:beta-lactamase regulating signal transducer with metallopeptidase domain
MTAWFSGFQLSSLANASPAGTLLFKVTLVLSAALAADFLLHRRFPLACAAMWNGVLVALAILPVAWLALPAARVPQPAGLAENSPGDAAPIIVHRKDSALVDVAPSRRTEGSVLKSDPVGAPSVSAIATRPWSAALAALYLIGCGASLLRLCHGLRVVARLRRSSRITSAAWTDRLAHWRSQCGIAQPVALKESPTVSVPLVIGHWAATIILPADMVADSDETTCDAILIHELAHVARRDYAWQILQRLLGAALWFHPLFWCAERRLRFIRERVCDEFVVHRIGSSCNYIGTLLDMASRLTRSPTVSLGMAVLRSSHLGDRLAAIHDSRGCPSYRAGRGLRFAVLATALTLAGWFGRSAIAEQEVPRIEGLTADAQTLLDEFDTDAKRLRDEAERKIAAKRAELERQLRALQTHYTREDKLDEAVAIRDQIRLLRAATIAAGTPLTVLSDPGNMTQYVQSVGKSYFIKVVGSDSGVVWGTNEYTHDSSLAAAAVHAGVMQVGETGVVKVTMLPGRTFYAGTQRNGITSQDWYNTYGGYESFKIVERAPPEIPDLANAKVGIALPTWTRTHNLPNGTVANYPYDNVIDYYGLRAYPGQSFDVLVGGTADPDAHVWGTDVYTDDSSLSAAAVHAGAVRTGETASVRVTILPGRASYDGSDRNGVASHAWGSFTGSFSVQRVGKSVGTAVLQGGLDIVRAYPIATELNFKALKEGSSHEVQVTGTADPSAAVWGTDIYTDDSSLSAAAVHAGAVRPGETAVVRVTVLPGRATYDGTVRNGVASHPWGNFAGSFSVERVGPASVPIEP